MEILDLGTKDATAAEPSSQAPESTEGTGTGTEPVETTFPDGTYRDIPGFCRSVSLAEIKEADYALTPGRYVGMAEAAADDEPLDEKIARLTAQLQEQFAESDRLQAVVREQLGRL